MDDAVLVADTGDNLQRLINNFNITEKQYMDVATETHDCMGISKEQVT